MNNFLRGWQIKKLSELLSKSDSGVWGQSPVPSCEATPVLRSTNIRPDGILDYSDVANRLLKQKQINDLLLKDNDILLEKSGGGPSQPVGRIAFFINPDNRKYLFANFIQRLRANESVIVSRFLFLYLYYLYKINVTLKFQSQTTGIRNLNLKRYFELDVPVPPMEVQQRIVERLDAIRKAQELNDKQIELAEELFQSILHQELDPTGKDWQVLKFGNLCIKTKQSHPSKLFKESFRYIDIESVDSKTNSVKQTKLIDVNNAPSRARKLVEKDDVIFATTRPYLKNIAYIDGNFDNCIASTGFCVIRASKNIAISKFLFFVAISKPFISKVLVFQRGASYPAVSDNDIFKTKIPVPQLDIQQQIVKKLTGIQDYKKSLLTQKEKLKELFDSTLAKSITGDMDTRQIS